MQDFNNKYRPAKRTGHKSSKKLKLRWVLLALILLSIIISLVYYQDHDKGPVKPAATKQQAVTKKTADTVTNTLNKLQTKKKDNRLAYLFYGALANQEVDTDSKSIGDIDPNHNYFIQIASTKSESDADQIKQQLSSQATMKAMHIFVEDNNYTDRYKVLIGPYTSVNAAGAVLQIIRKFSYKDSFILRRNKNNTTST